ncbi:BAG family molecular chaperone regulator 5, mitochondrial-like [Melia azedarach]|uniref:BAG family molecular chaperone regulator 5, mitochondrial-like n=1 Tax=Melia azedarach TaxID=155640 RepID=A0ACC1X1F1_MELAZ|nr:BAG family molecular chaperone regulator 5, mitochondrial-like [Melia azedarach]
MKSSPNFAVFSASSTATVTYAFRNDHIATEPTTEVPIQSSSQLQSQAAAKIQAAYKAHVIRSLYKKISSVNSEANHFQRLIQRQETVDSIRSDEREKLRMNEALMGLLLRLDSVPGFNPSIREARRKVSRRIVGLQEILDGICGSNVDDDEFDEWGPFGYWKDLDKVVERMEEEICRERGGDEMEKFCAQHLGFRCLQRFLRD